MKTIKLIFLLIFINCHIYGQNTVKHIVQRGETISSIAQKYGITEKELVEKNPSIKDFLYTGMELKIIKSTPITNNIQNKEMESKDTSETIKNNYNTSDYIKGNDYSINLSFNDPFELGLGIGFDTGKYGYGYLGGNLAIFDNYEISSISNFAIGFGGKQRFRTDAFILTIKAFPYIGLLSTNYKEDKTDYDFTYGATANISAGIKMWTTSKGNDAFITIGYCINAPEFETKDLLKNGLWQFGLTLVFNK